MSLFSYLSLSIEQGANYNPSPYLKKTMEIDAESGSIDAVDRGRRFSARELMAVVFGGLRVVSACQLVWGTIKAGGMKKDQK